MSKRRDEHKRKHISQSLLPFRSWGGRRAGAGRKPEGERAGVSHRTRDPLASRYPVHVTVRLRRGLPTLRKRSTYTALRAAFAAGCERFGFRMVHYSVQSNHLHLLAEARDRASLSRGMQGLLVRVAKALNKLWQRRGSVFADRYHDHVLRTPREVRNALAYVLNNGLRHGMRFFRRARTPRGMGIETVGLDPYASGGWFRGWREQGVIRGVQHAVRPVAAAHTWLLDVGWRRCRLIGIAEVPKGKRLTALRVRRESLG